MVDHEHIELLASKLARLYVKQREGTTRKWEKMAPEERR